MAIKTYTQQLEEVQQAISTIMQTGQSVMYNGRKMDRADLSVLDKMEVRLQAKVQMESRKNKRSRVYRITQL